MRTWAEALVGVLIGLLLILIIALLIGPPHTIRPRIIYVYPS